MKKYFANYNQSLALGELGWNGPCFGGWNHPIDNKEPYFQPNQECEYDIKAPLKSQVFEWFREKHGLWVSFGYDEDESEELYWYVDKILECGIGRLFFHDLIEYYTYEEAESACIDKLIEITKKK